MPDLATELVRLKVDLPLTSGTPATRAAKQATQTIPIVMATGGDAVATGLVASLARPGGNVTGLSFLGRELSAKYLELLKETVPRISRVAVLWDLTIGGAVLKEGETDMLGETAGRFAVGSGGTAFALAPMMTGGPHEGAHGSRPWPSSPLPSSPRRSPPRGRRAGTSVA